MTVVCKTAIILLTISVIIQFYHNEYMCVEFRDLVKCYMEIFHVKHTPPFLRPKILGKYCALSKFCFCSYKCMLLYVYS